MNIRAWADEFGVFVAGTDNPVQAAAFLATWHNPECRDYIEHTRDGNCWSYAGKNPEKAKLTWQRTVPGCPAWCGEDHIYHYYDATPGSRGAFPVVEWSY